MIRSRSQLSHEKKVAQYAVLWTAQCDLHFTPWQTCPFRHQLDFSEKHSSQAANRREDYSLTFPPLSIARYSLIQLSELGRRGEKNPNFETVAKGIRTQALSIASLAFYRAPKQN